METGAVFLGYVIHAPDQDDYLMVQKSGPMVEGRLWVKLPQLAKYYGTLRAAHKVLSRLDVAYRVEVWELWETDRQYLACPLEETNQTNH